MRERSAALWAEVKENHAKLRGCRDHDFSIDLTPDRALGKDWRCTHCGGRVDSLHKGWYEEGRAHQRAIDGRE